MRPQLIFNFLMIILTVFNSNVNAQMIRVTPGNFSNHGWTTEQVDINPPGAIRLTIGGGTNASDFNDFKGYLDFFKISKSGNTGNYTTYDFKGKRCRN